MQPKEIYLFSGLGADERAFQLLDFSGYSHTFVRWIAPEGQESMSQYATRLLAQIKAERPVLIGLSFGGMMAVEVAKQIAVEKVIIIASAKTGQEIPFYYRWAGFLRLHRLVPVRLLKQHNFLANWFFGIESDFDRQLLKQILADTDPQFLVWAIGQIAQWNNRVLLPNLFHIHGGKDRILPLQACDRVIPGGGHLMALNKAKELNEVLRGVLAGL